MATVQVLEELEVWQMARTFSKEVRQVLLRPCFKDEPGLRHQLKNASGSVMDNIAEGFGRGSKHEFVNSLTIARGSLVECRSQIYRCADMGFVSPTERQTFLAASELLLRRISTLINYLNATPVKGSKFKNRK